jgi:soluble lytic murein transglycosylase-like protein
MSIFAAVPTIAQWDALIVRYAEMRQLDPRVVGAIMLLESLGDPAAISCCGAVGLMQVIPSDTENEKLRKWFSDRPTTAELLDPERNIDEGTRILAQGYRAFAGDAAQQQKAIVSYYQGIGRTTRHGLTTEDAKFYLVFFGRAWRELFGDAALPWEKADAQDATLAAGAEAAALSTDAVLATAAQMETGATEGQR